jgi:hypothetical protein
MGHEAGLAVPVWVVPVWVVRAALEVPEWALRVVLVAPVAAWDDEYGTRNTHARAHTRTPSLAPRR